MNLLVMSDNSIESDWDTRKGNVADDVVGHVCFQGCWGGFTPVYPIDEALGNFGQFLASGAHFEGKKPVALWEGQRVVGVEMGQRRDRVVIK
jgi:hypothetical protein